MWGIFLKALSPPFSLVNFHLVTPSQTLSAFSTSFEISSLTLSHFLSFFLEFLFSCFLLSVLLSRLNIPFIISVVFFCLIFPSSIYLPANISLIFFSLSFLSSPPYPPPEPTGSSHPSLAASLFYCLFSCVTFLRLFAYSRSLPSSI